MSNFRFFQGVRGEWVWYRLADTGSVLAKGDGAFATLGDCMSNAQRFGFDGHTFVVQGQSEQSLLLSERQDAGAHDYIAPPPQQSGSNGEPAQG